MQFNSLQVLIGYIFPRFICFVDPRTVITELVNVFPCVGSVAAAGALGSVAAAGALQARSPVGQERGAAGPDCAALPWLNPWDPLATVVRHPIAVASTDSFLPSCEDNPGQCFVFCRRAGRITQSSPLPLFAMEWHNGDVTGAISTAKNKSAVLVVLIGGSLFVQMPGMAVLWLVFAVQGRGQGKDTQSAHTPCCAVLSR